MFSFTAGVAENSWGEVSMFGGGKFPLPPKDSWIKRCVPAITSYIRWRLVSTGAWLLIVLLQLSVVGVQVVRCLHERHAFQITIRYDTIR